MTRHNNGNPYMTLKWLKLKSSNNTVNTFLKLKVLCLQEPLWSLINDTGTTEFSQQIWAGTTDIDGLPINEYTKDLLFHLKSNVPPTKNPNHPLDTDSIISGFKMWPERTSMSTSGWHLGIYKLLAKNFPLPKNKDNPVPPEPPDPIQCGNDILKLLITMLNLAMTHTHTYDQWKTIWTLLLV